MYRKLVYVFAIGLLLAMAGGVQAQLVQGKVLVEYWYGGGVDAALGNLKAHPDFPDNPHEVALLDALDQPDRPLDYWGARLRAILTAPADGDYTFWVASDDDSELWLSTDTDPANAAMICSVAGWTGYYDWVGASGAPGDNQQSDPVTLVAGQQYYVEYLFTDGTGGGFGSVAWAGPTIGDEPTVVAGDYLAAEAALIPAAVYQAKNPDPGDGAIDVTAPLFKWEAGMDAAMHEVYFGTNPEPGPAEFKGPMPVPMYFHVMPLEPGVTYYWRVDEVKADGTKHAGNVWSFTVMPVKATEPSPADGAAYQIVTTKLGWKAGQGMPTHDVYFGTDQAAVAAGDASVFLGNVAENAFDPGQLEYETTYYWRIDELPTGADKVVGDVWGFSTTMAGLGAATREIWYDIGGGTSVDDLLSAEKFLACTPDVVDEVANFQSPDLGIDNYGGRLSAWLYVPVTGEYTFWVAGDDNCRLYLGADPGQAVQIAEVPGWSGMEEWDRSPEQKSEPIFLEEGNYFIQALWKEGGGGDACSAGWQGPVVPDRGLITGGFLAPYGGEWASAPSPADGAANVAQWLPLTWCPGAGAVAHDVYVGTDAEAVANGDASVYLGQQAEIGVILKDLAWGKTYSWRIDEVSEAGDIKVGPVWSFTTAADYIPVVAAETTLNYDNTVEPFVSEVDKALAVAQNWTVKGVSTLQLQLRGAAPKFAANADGSVVLSAAGTDIWDNSDEFRYAYKELNGDATMVARVVSNGSGSNEWAKGGVMIRQSTEGGSTHAFMPITAGGGNGASFQRRPVADSGSANNDSGQAVAPPYWVKIERAGNAFSGSISPDGQTWTQLGDPVEIAMTDPVLIGLAVTSHASGEMRAFVFDSISATGEITGDWQVADVGVAQGGNDPAPLYVAVEDAAGGVAVATHPGNPDMTLTTDWTAWKIQLDKLVGVDLTAITKVVFGAGDGQPDGMGAVSFDDVQVVKPFVVELAKTSLTLTGTDRQLTDHAIVQGEVFTLKVRVRVSKGVIWDGKNLTMTLYYDDEGARIPVASKTGPCAEAPKEYSLSFDSDDVPESAGHLIGIEFKNEIWNRLALDKVSLSGR